MSLWLKMNSSHLNEFYSLNLTTWFLFATHVTFFSHHLNVVGTKFYIFLSQFPAWRLQLVKALALASLLDPWWVCDLSSTMIFQSRPIKPLFNSSYFLFAVKVPQILKLYNAKSGEGMTMTSLVMELFAISANLAYSYHNGFPFRYDIKPYQVSFSLLPAILSICWRI